MSKLPISPIPTSHLAEYAAARQSPSYLRFLTDLPTDYIPPKFVRPAQPTQRLRHAILLPFYKVLAYHYTHGRTVIFTLEDLPPKRRGLRDSSIHTYLFNARSQYFPTGTSIRVESPARGYFRVLAGDQRRIRKGRRAIPISGVRTHLELATAEDITNYMLVLSKQKGRVTIKGLTEGAQGIMDQYESGFRPLPDGVKLNKENDLWILAH